MTDGLLAGGSALLEPEAILMVALGSLISVIFGVIPGIGSVTAIALLYPFIFGMERMNGIFFLTGLLGTAAIGGAVTAILLNIPGTVINAATCLDGHPMARKGEAGRAIGIAVTSSVFGMFFGLLILIALIPLVLQIIFAFGPPEFFMMIMFGLVTVCFASRGNMIKGLISAAIGILIALFGLSPTTGVMRFNFTSDTYMFDGIPLIPFFVGLFAVREVIRFWVGGSGSIAIGGQRIKAGFSGILEGAFDVWRYRRAFLQSSGLGTLIGMLPGVGGTVANFLGYTLGMQTSKHPELFGTGHPEGVVASESSNNAKDGGALMPALAFGIPGSLEMAMLLGAFTLLGLAPGPFFIRDHPDIVWALIFGYALSALICATIVLLSADLLARITVIKVKFLLPVVLTFSLVGVYAARENVWDPGLAILVGVFGYALERFGFSIIAMAIGFVLGELAERAFIQSLQGSLYDYSVFFTRPISLTLCLLAVGLFLLPFIKVGLAGTLRVIRTQAIRSGKN